MKTGLAGAHLSFFARAVFESRRDYNHSAQGCEERVTLGGRNNIHNPEEGCIFAWRANDATPGQTTHEYS
jgi:hypothetical protein